MWDTEEEESFPEGEEGDPGIQSRMMNSRTGVGWNIPEYTPPPDLGGPPSAPDQGIIGFNPAILQPPTTSSNSGMECPMTHCNSVLTPPIYQCSNGHAICSRCVERLDYCTQCMASLDDDQKTRNFALEQILFQNADIQNHNTKCPNELQGCMEVGPSDFISSHAETCKFRGSHFCAKLFGWKNCSASVGRAALVHHLRDNHAIKETDETKFALNLITPSSALDAQNTTQHQGGGIVWNPLLISSAFDSDILLKYYLFPGGYLNIAGYLLGGVDDDDDDDGEWKKYRIKVEINSASKVARLEWTGCLISILQSNSDDDLAASNVNAFRIPLNSLEKYVKATEELELEETALSKIKVKVAIWKYDDNDGELAFKQNVFLDEGGEKEPLSKFTFLGKEPTAGDDEQDAFTFPLESFIHSNGRMMMATEGDQEEYARYYSMDSCCTYCTRPLFGDVTYQCLQCPQTSDTLAATYFCRNCIEVGNQHSEHLTLRISRPALQPLAAVVYECAKHELQ